MEFLASVFEISLYNDTEKYASKMQSGNEWICLIETHIRDISDKKMWFHPIKRIVYKKSHINIYKHIKFK